MGQTDQRDRLDGWQAGAAGPILATVEIVLTGGNPQSDGQIRLAIDPSAKSLAAWAAGRSQHYFRLADATLRPMPAETRLALARGDAYIALSPGALRLASRPAVARYLHVRDDFNAERLAEGLLHFLADEYGQAALPEDVTVLVIEAR